MKRDCCWCAYEKDLGEYFCQHPEHESGHEYGQGGDPCEGCKDYYTREDAKSRSAPEGKD